MADRISITTAQLDAFCRALKATVGMIEGPAVASFEFPMFHTDYQEEVSVKVQAFRCSSCEDIHVQCEIQRPARLYDWNQEASDERLFGSPE